MALEIAKPRVPGFAPLFFLYFYRISPLMARLFGGESEAYHYLPNSLKIFKSREELADSMRGPASRRSAGMISRVVRSPFTWVPKPATDP